MRKFKKVLLYLFIILLVGIQFVQIDKTPPPENASIVFSEVENVPVEVLSLLESACYDCHSYRTEFPWYTYIQPVGIWLRSHVRGAQQNLNFSEWGTYSEEDKPLILREAAEEIGEDQMPPKSFRLMHPEARLSDEEKQLVISWLENYESQ
ncbi:MAG: heme-binding domain-containing protein [Chitinophagales bacterium]|nr:heme-binding domain-containing protein [Chitinophagales bacterium]